MTDRIATPRGAIIKTKDGTTCKLVWNPNFAPKRNQQYSRAQKFVDLSVLRLSAPYVPLRTSMLLNPGSSARMSAAGKYAISRPMRKSNTILPASRAVLQVHCADRSGLSA